jgi:hypothetical protein
VIAVDRNLLDSIPSRRISNQRLPSQDGSRWAFTRLVRGRNLNLTVRNPQRIAILSNLEYRAANISP